MLHNSSKVDRVLTLYRALCSGKVVRKSEYARTFHVDERTIQRDIDDIRAYLADTVVSGASGGLSVVYNREKQGFLLDGCPSSLMTNSEILAVSKILLSSRAFTKEEISLVLDKLISGCVPMDNMKLVSDLLANEKFHYTEINNPAGIQEKLWTLGQDVHDHRLLEIQYCRQGQCDTPVTRVIEPVSLVFSEYYFYLNAYIDREEKGRYVHTYDYPAVFRVDRILAHKDLEQQFSLPYANRFQEGEFLKRVQFMYPGHLVTLRFRYTGASVEAILDRLPTAVVTEQDDQGFTIKAEVYGKGILMWLLSQGDQVEILSPDSLRIEMKAHLEKMLALYQS